MFIPPYSTLACEGKRRLPHYTPIVWQEEVKPFDTITGRRSGEAPSEASHDSDQVAPTSTLSIVDLPARRPTARLPPITAGTFPAYNYDPWSAIRRSQAFEPPKYTPSSTLPPPSEYDPVETQARIFRLRVPFIYANKMSNLPKYQVSQELDRGGKPRMLKLRRLRPREMRSCSVPAIHSTRVPRIQYDDDETMYTMTAFEMHGYGESDLGGNIQFTSGRTLWGGTWTKIWHVTKPDRRDSWDSNLDIRQLNRSRRTRGLYKGDRILLYSIRKGVWEDGDGTVVAREDKIGKIGKMLEMAEVWARDQERTDLVVACWVMRVWTGEESRWEGM